MVDITLRKKIVLVHLFSNGDCLYATTIARQIKIDYPGCELTWAISESCKAIINNNPFVDVIKVVPNIPKNSLSAFRNVKQKFHEEQTQGIWDKVFITQNMDQNQALYDGCIRFGILNAYPNPITVDTTPVLRLTDSEKERVRSFVEQYSLESFRHKIIFEFAPQSGQFPISLEFAILLAEELVQNTEVAIIMSSANKINHPSRNIIDGSQLTLRETAGLSFFCTHMIGCSSGISWAITSDAAKMLPMIQLVDPSASWINPVSRDFERRKLSTSNIIDIITLDKTYIKKCVYLGIESFDAARTKYHQEIPLSFKTSRAIVYNLLCQLQFRSIAKHISVNKKVYGNNMQLYKQILLAFFLFPFTLIGNFFRKRVFK